MRTLEASIERTIKRWAYGRKDELLYWKFTVPGLRGVPDRIALYKGGRVVFLELKRAGEKPRKLQKYIIRRMRAFGFTVLVCDNTDEAIAQLEAYIELYNRET